VQITTSACESYEHLELAEKPNGSASQYPCARWLAWMTIIRKIQIVEYVQSFGVITKEIGREKTHQIWFNTIAFRWSRCVKWARRQTKMTSILLDTLCAKMQKKLLHHTL